MSQETMLEVHPDTLRYAHGNLLYATLMCGVERKPRPYGPLQSHQWDPCPSCDGPWNDPWYPDGATDRKCCSNDFHYPEHMR